MNFILVKDFILFILLGDYFVKFISKVNLVFKFLRCVIRSGIFLVIINLFVI